MGGEPAAIATERAAEGAAESAAEGAGEAEGAAEGVDEARPISPPDETERGRQSPSKRGGAVGLLRKLSFTRKSRSKGEAKEQKQGGVRRNA